MKANHVELLGPGCFTASLLHYKATSWAGIFTASLLHYTTVDSNKQTCMSSAEKKEANEDETAATPRNGVLHRGHCLRGASLAHHLGTCR
jgi:hypothetical protein